MPPAVTVIIVNYNAGPRLARALSCLAAQTFRDFRVIVFDNASTDGSLEGLDGGGLTLDIVRHPENIGFAAANNRAAAMTKSGWLAFLNPDAYPEPGWLAALMDAAGRVSDADAFGSLQIDANDPARLDGAGDAYFAAGQPYRGHFGWPAEKAPGDGETFAACAAAMLVRRRVFAALGGFAESFFCYGEDVDFGFRLRLAGGWAVQVSAARVLHEGSGLSGRRSDFAVYHGHRNRVWTFVRNMPPGLFWPLAPFHLGFNLLLGLVYMPTPSRGPYWRAMRDAAAGLGRVWAERGEIQAGRKVRLSDIAGALTWSPLKAARREADIRSL